MYQRLALIALLLVPLVSAEPSDVTLETPRFIERDYRLVAGRYQPSWITCDGATAVAIISKVGANQVRIESFLKRTSSRTKTALYALGAGEGAAGSVYYDLTPSAGRSYLRLTQALNYDDARRQPASLHTPDLELSCGRVIGTRFYAVTGKRSISIYNDPSGGLHYVSFEYADARANQVPSLSLSGGTMLGRGAGRVSYVFRNGQFTYRVDATSQPPSATIRVYRGAALLQTEVPRAYADVRDRP